MNMWQKPFCWSSQVAWTINWSAPFPYYPDFKQQQPVRYKLFPHFEILFLIILTLSTILISIGGRDSGHSDPCSTFVSKVSFLISEQMHPALLFFCLQETGLWWKISKRSFSFVLNYFSRCTLHMLLLVLHLGWFFQAMPFSPLHASVLPILPVAPHI